jgi:galactokinase
MTDRALVEKFYGLFGSEPKLFRAPGRVNLIGEHTDYNEGFVLPCAIGFHTWIAAFLRNDDKLVLHSENFPDKFEFDVRELPSKRLSHWCDYVLGVAGKLQQTGHRIRGANILVKGEVPIGSGLSSSAAVEVASAMAFLGLEGEALPLPDVARICQSAENNFVGARVGIMDQFVSCLGKAAHALLLDCRSLEYNMIPVPEGVRFVVCNTMVKHDIAGGEYNARREECDEAVKLLAKSYPGTRALRDVSLKQLRARGGELPKKTYNRALHVISENRRVHETVDALVSGDMAQAGRLMLDSHQSLRDLYEVSCPELDIMVEVANGVPGYFGGRMTGGGFGGCTVNLVNASDADSFSQQVAERYRSRTGIAPDIYVCFPVNGAGADLTELRTIHQ